MKEKYWKYIMIIPLLVIIVFFIVYPLVTLVLVTFDTEISSHFYKLLEDASFWKSVKTTLIFVVVSVLIELFLGLGLALLVTDIENTWVRSLFLLPMMVAPTAVGLIWRIIFQPMFGLANIMSAKLGLPVQGWLGDPKLAMPSVIIVEVWQWTCFVYLILLAGLKSIPKDCYEAAVMDGAGSWAVFRHITLPLLKPTIFIAVLFRSVDAFKALDKFVTLTGGGPGEATEVLALHIYKVSFKFMEIEYGAFLALIALIIVLIYNFIFTRILGSQKAIGGRRL